MMRNPSHGTPATSGGKVMSSKIKSGFSMRTMDMASAPSWAVAT